MRIIHPDNKPTSAEKGSQYLETTIKLRLLINGLLNEGPFRKLAIDAATTSIHHPQENRVRVCRLIGGLFSEESVRELVKKASSSDLEDMFFDALYDYEIPDSDIGVKSDQKIADPTVQTNLVKARKESRPPKS